jgi:hypothetical protein
VKRLLLLLAALVAVVVALPVTFSSGHPERPTSFPDPHVGKVPKFRTGGPTIVVCKRDSARRLHRDFRGNKRALRTRLALMKKCKFRDIQPAVNHAKSGTRILIMPGVYKEMASRRVPFTPKKCSDQSKYFAITEGYGNEGVPPPAGRRSNDPPVRANFRFQHDCPNAHNLIAIIGNKRATANDNPNPAPRCDQHCNLQLIGMGRIPENVDIKGDRTKMDVIRADRVEGLAIRNLTTEYAAFNGIDGVSLNGFHLDHIVSRWNQNYGVLTFTSDHGLYENINAFGNGDSGVYPGSAAKGCSPSNGYTNRRYGTELRNINSHDNVLGYSGTAGNSTWVHNSRFHNNATGLSTDSFASGHPGMPQECFKWEHNEINSNNLHLFGQANQTYCSHTPFPKRKEHHVCPQFQVPEGSGVIIYGGNRDELQHNAIYDNWRSGVRLFGVPAAIRGDNNPADQSDTSNGNKIVFNRFGRSPSGTRAPNGKDITWDHQGVHNCQQGNTSADGPVTFSDGVMPACPGAPVNLGPNDALGKDAPCAAWDPNYPANQMPPGCSWFTLPPRPH